MSILIETYARDLQVNIYVLQRTVGSFRFYIKFMLVEFPQYIRYLHYSDRRILL